ncbi:MAG TPA: calcium-binding protein [Ilumatobacteraceae bacterium]|nr:calcium-binding protein [Ilumatobacteraceae bacterium]
MSLQNGVVTYEGDPGADTVELMRVSSQGQLYYLVTDDTSMQGGSGCTKASNANFVFCASSPLRRYAITGGGANDVVSITGDTLGGTADLGAGNDGFTGRTTGTAGDAVRGGDGDDILRGGTGDDAVSGDGGNDQVAGQAGNDAVDGGAGDDQLEFGGPAMAEGVGSGADDVRGGPGSDRTSYLDRAARVSVSLDDKAGDGVAGEGDNVHGDVEVVVGSELDDALAGNDGAQQLFGNAGFDRLDGLGGDDVLNGGTGGDELYGGAGRDRLEGSAGEDYLEGGSGDDLYEGDNVCTADPCTGGSDFIQARDGEADTVHCGVGADTALVDDIDVVAQDTQHGCERIERTTAAAAPPAAGQGGVLGETALPVPTLRVVGARKLGTLRRGKFRIEVTCAGSCRVKARLIAGRTVVASKSRTRLGAGVVRLSPKTSKKGRKTLGRRSRVRMTLAVDVTDEQGRVTTLARVLTFRRR